MVGAERGEAMAEEGSEAGGRRREGASRGDSDGFFGVGDDGDDRDKGWTSGSAEATDAAGSWSGSGGAAPMAGLTDECGGDSSRRDV